MERKFQTVSTHRGFPTPFNIVAKSVEHTYYGIPELYIIYTFIYVLFSICRRPLQNVSEEMLVVEVWYVVKVFQL